MSAPVPPVLRTERIAHLSRDCCAEGFQFALCRVGVQTRSFGDVGSMSGLRESGHPLARRWVTLAEPSAFQSGSLVSSRDPALARTRRGQRPGLLLND